jgi:hypothetical protein
MLGEALWAVLGHRFPFLPKWFCRERMREICGILLP